MERNIVDADEDGDGAYEMEVRFQWTLSDKVS
jgi:hypothetical protein